MDAYSICLGTGNRVIAFSLFGDVFITEDAGGSWKKMPRAFGEIRTAAWLPSPR